MERAKIQYTKIDASTGRKSLRLSTVYAVVTDIQCSDGIMTGIARIHGNMIAVMAFAAWFKDAQSYNTWSGANDFRDAYYNKRDYYA